MSTASANPASKGLIALRARGLTKRLDEQACIRTGFAEKTFYLLKDALETLDAEAPPAAERTAVQSLKDLYNFIQDKRNRAHKYLKTHPEDLRVRGQRQGYEVIRVRLKQALDRFDAQERAGAQA